MKKIVKRLVLIAMLAALTICATFGTSADTNIGNTYHIENITVVFDANSQLSEEQ